MLHILKWDLSSPVQFQLLSEIISRNTEVFQKTDHKRCQSYKQKTGSQHIHLSSVLISIYLPAFHHVTIISSFTQKHLKNGRSSNFFSTCQLPQDDKCWICIYQNCLFLSTHNRSVFHCILLNVCTDEQSCAPFTEIKRTLLCKDKSFFCLLNHTKCC